MTRAASAAPAALATHTGQPVPEGTITVEVPSQGVVVTAFVESPVAQEDQLIGDACAETVGLPAGCVYDPPTCARDYAHVPCGPPVLPLVGPLPNPGWPPLPVRLPDVPPPPPIPPL